MWGSSGAQPGPVSNQRFAGTKVDNTPHFFQVGTVPVEVYFSPSDRTTSKIVSALNRANNDLEFALLTLTRSDISNAITNAHRRGVQVRGIIENINDQSSRFQPLVDSGVSVVGDNQSWQLHHKYGIVDAAGGSNGNPMVITGSHNWSTSAETVNDENTLLIYNATIANLFLQEFARRWCDVQGGVCQFAIGVEDLAGQSLNPQILPNPVSSQCRLLLDLGQSGAKLQGRLSNALGQEVKTWQWGWLQGAQQLDLDLSDLPAGIYYLSLPTRLGMEVLSIQKQ
jgi:phosphatidylserine/phosphatidylglycerophosphate/cardiolipin synthase-like enzyme